MGRFLHHRRVAAIGALALAEQDQLAGDVGRPADRRRPRTTWTGSWPDQSAARLYSLIHRLEPLESQIMLLYLEDLDAAEISAITGLRPGNVATKVHRIKRLLTRFYHSKDPSHE